MDDWRVGWTRIWLREAYPLGGECHGMEGVFVHTVVSAMMARETKRDRDVALGILSPFTATTQCPQVELD